MPAPRRSSLLPPPRTAGENSKRQLTITLPPAVYESYKQIAAFRNIKLNTLIGHVLNTILPELTAEMEREIVITTETPEQPTTPDLTP